MANLTEDASVEPDIAIWAKWLEGTLHATAGRTDQAIGAFRLVLERFPEFSEGHAALGAMLMKTEDRQAGQASFDRAISIALTRRNYLQRIQLLAENGAHAQILKLTEPET